MSYPFFVLGYFLFHSFFRNCNICLCPFLLLENWHPYGQVYLIHIVLHLSIKHGCILFLCLAKITLVDTFPSICLIHLSIGRLCFTVLQRWLPPYQSRPHSFIHSSSLSHENFKQRPQLQSQLYKLLPFLSWIRSLFPRKGKIDIKTTYIFCIAKMILRFQNYGSGEADSIYYIISLFLKTQLVSMAPRLHSTHTKKTQYKAIQAPLLCCLTCCLFCLRESWSR